MAVKKKPVIEKDTKDIVTPFLLSPQALEGEYHPPDDVRYFEAVIDKMFSEDNLEQKTDLTLRQIIAITKVQTYADVYKVPIADQVATRIMNLSISNKRLGRKEIENVAISAIPRNNDVMETMNTRLLGKKD
jgi:hypothetical protein